MCFTPSLLLSAALGLDHYFIRVAPPVMMILFLCMNSAVVVSHQWISTYFVKWLGYLCNWHSAVVLV